jgi:enoyl-CoA hydratase
VIEPGVSITRAANLADVVLENSVRKNAISASMWHTLRTFADAARNDTSLKAIIVRGSDTVFSAGADIAGFEAGRSGHSSSDYDDLVETTACAFEELPQIVIAAVAGPCIGAGATLACACDFRVAEQESFFAVPAARLGLGYDPRGISRFLRVFGDSATREMLLLGSRTHAARAHGIGAVNELVAKGEAVGTAHRIANVAMSLAPLTQQASKFALRELSTSRAVSKAALDLAAVADASRDYGEGRAAFSEKRLPRFTGL